MKSTRGKLFNFELGQGQAKARQMGTVFNTPPASANLTLFQTNNAGNLGNYILPAMPKGNVRTSIAPIPPKCIRSNLNTRWLYAGLLIEDNTWCQMGHILADSFLTGVHC